MIDQQNLQVGKTYLIQFIEQRDQEPIGRCDRVEEMTVKRLTETSVLLDNVWQFGGKDWYCRGRFTGKYLANHIRVLEEIEPTVP